MAVKRTINDTVVAICNTCSTAPNRLPCSGATLHKRLIAPSTALLGRPHNMQCLQCGTTHSAYYQGRTI